MKTRERNVHFYDIKPVTYFRRSEVVPPQMASARAFALAFEVWRDLGAARTPWRAGERVISLDAWEFNRQRGEHYLVVNCADPNRADIAFKHMRTGAARMAGKLPEEAWDLSAHLLIRPPPRGADAALLLMTNGAGLGAPKLATILGMLLRQAKVAHPGDFRRDHPNAVPGDTLDAHVKFTVAGHQSRFLRHVLAGGVLEGVDLIAEGVAALDGDRGFQSTGRILQVKAVDDRPITLARLRRVITMNQPDTTKARVRFREDPDGKVETQTLPINALESAFVRKEEITFETDIASRYVQVNHTIVDKLRELI